MEAERAATDSIPAERTPLLASHAPVPNPSTHAAAPRTYTYEEILDAYWSTPAGEFEMSILFLVLFTLGTAVVALALGLVTYGWCVQ